MELEKLIKIEGFSFDIASILGNADVFIWSFDNAPKELRDYSVNGGDEDWLVLLKKDYCIDTYLPFLEQGNYKIGFCSVDQFDLGEYVMLVGTHS